MNKLNYLKIIFSQFLDHQAIFPDEQNLPANQGIVKLIVVSYVILFGFICENIISYWFYNIFILKTILFNTVGIDVLVFKLT